MFIQTEATPNPNTLKFLPGRDVMPADGPSLGGLEFTSLEDAKGSPLAERLFAIGGVSGVFLGGDFIAVSKQEDQAWELLKPSLLGVIMEFFLSGAPIIAQTNVSAQSGSGEKSNAQSQDDANLSANLSEEDRQIGDTIRELLDTRVRPAVAQDGGDIIFQGFDKGVVYLVMRGACAGCPSSTATLKMGIENMLKHYIPEVVEVRAVA